MTAELRHIEAFLAVARLGNFTRAAAALNVSQPALTVQIRQFEQALGLKLFDRNNRRVALTAAGRDLVGPLERVSLDVRSIVAHARDLQTHRRGAVTVAALPSVAAGLLPRAIRTLAGRHQGLTVRVRDAIAGRVIEMVRGAEVDFGIGTLVRADRDLVSEPLFDDSLCAFAPEAHPLARLRRVRLADLAAYPLVLTGLDSSVRQIVERALERARVSVNVAQEVTYMSTAIAMVYAGLGIAILPESALAPGAGVRARAIAIVDPPLRRQIGILHHRARSLSPAAEQFADVLRQSVRLRPGAPLRRRRADA